MQRDLNEPIMSPNVGAGLVPALLFLTIVKIAVNVFI
jgi:hypothetical protein